MSNLFLLNHQLQAAEAVLDALRRQQARILVEMPLQSGKTKVIEYIVRELLEGLSPVLILAYTRVEVELLQQRLAQLGAGRRELIRFATVAQLLRSERDEEGGLQGGEIVITPEALSFANQWGETRVSGVLAGARAVVAFASAPSIEVQQSFGEPVYSLSTAEAASAGMLSAPVFHAMPAYFRSPAWSAEALRQAVRLAVPAVGERRTVFICRDLAEVDAAYHELNAARHGGIRLIRISSREKPALPEEIASAGWLVLTARRATGYDLGDIGDVVLLRSFTDRAALLQATRFGFRIAPSSAERHVWDFGGNAQLWAEAGLSVDETAPQDGAVTLTGPSEPPPGRAGWVRPIADGAASRDLMQRERLVQVLRSIIRSKSQNRSLAIGLFGRWGSGKSTVVSLLRNQVGGERDVEIIEFNAWENETVGSMPAALADAIMRQVYAGHSWIGRLWLRLKHRILIDDAALGLTLLVLLLCALTLAPLEALDGKYRFQAYALWNETMRIWITGAVTLLFAAQLAWKSPLTQGLRSFLKHISYAEHIGLTHRIRSELAGLFRASRFRLRDYLPSHGKAPAKPKTYVLVVDDLDRCSRENVWRTVEATRLVAEFREVVLVFAVDYRVLFDAVAQRLQDKAAPAGASARLSREFLAKILQVSVVLPEPSPAAVARYINHALFDVPELPAGPAAGGAPEAPAHASLELPADAAGEEPPSESPAADEAEDGDEHLLATPGQALVFRECAALFGMTNPRSLLRLYNSMVLMKGLYPYIGDNTVEYRRHAFFLFLTETAAADGAPPDALLEALPDGVRNYAATHALLAASDATLNHWARQHVQACSLPIAPPDAERQS
ncbi:P-loop NTPase fold protein [Massilia endophytica]|uniref:P-loop NTPase fold protein n=1 Tax=Massilia endophytica TaxID=2899220 RepID=UPI001E5988F0|nr:P-loop NTPase fold protein [Massilia endophytica]UGQ46589.1 hypothetical protein LSQ66_22950 [Massilia endophytica]